MAADLELEPKPYHMIGFEDTNDCKSLCYIIQAQMEMLGNGHTFVVPQPPKDVFRDAKANDFGVTVMRKGELQLHMDQTLEEVEKQITEIRSKIYHDKIMQERSIDSFRWFGCGHGCLCNISCRWNQERFRWNVNLQGLKGSFQHL